MNVPSFGSVEEPPKRRATGGSTSGVTPYAGSGRGATPTTAGGLLGEEEVVEPLSPMKRSPTRGVGPGGTHALMSGVDTRGKSPRKYPTLEEWAGSKSGGKARR